MEVCVEIHSQFWNGYQAFAIEDVFVKKFEPLQTTDDVAMAYVTGGKLAGSRDAEIVIRLRKDAAKRIADVIATALVAEMSKNDTINGYRVVDEGGK